MSAFTEPELAYLKSQPLMRFATASPTGAPDIAPVIFSVEGDDIATAGFDITHTVRYRNIQSNPKMERRVINGSSSAD
jgi:pyridoxamine 5'-phosphate oxidase family protein